MVWRRIFHRDSEPDATQDERRSQPEGSDESVSHSAQPNENPPGTEPDSPRRVPPHLQEAFSQRQRRPGSDDPQARLATLRRRRNDALYDLEQGELAQSDDNPWRQRVALLTEALETVESDRTKAVNAPKEPFHPVESLLIRHPHVEFESDVTTVTFEIGGEHFAWEERLDWAERGHQITRDDLVQTAGSIDPLIPEGVPPALQEPLRAHLALSLFVLATDLRDRALGDEPAHSDLTLADLAKPCPECGGWTDVLGRCQACARRKAAIQQLDGERNRLLSERADELEEEHQMAERLSIARRRLLDIDNEIAALERGAGDAS